MDTFHLGHIDGGTEFLIVIVVVFAPYQQLHEVTRFVREVSVEEFLDAGGAFDAVRMSCVMPQA